jgi:uncharacterized protein (TIGR02996 family)
MGGRRDPSSATILHDQIVADPTDPAAYLVYADLLIARGDPRGELITLQHGAAHASGAAREELERAAAAHLAAHSDRLLGPIAAHGSPSWRYGFIEALTIRWSTDGADKYQLGWGETTVVDPAVASSELAAILDHDSMRLATRLELVAVPCEVAAAALAHPAIDRLDTLAILVTDWVALERVVEAIATRPRPRLTALTLGMADYVALSERMPGSESLSENTMNVGPVVANELWNQLAAATPNLVDLTLSGSRLFDAPGHPHVRTIAVIGGACDGLPFDLYDASANELPEVVAIRHTAVADDYRPFPIAAPHLEPARCPKLRELVFEGDYDLGNSDVSLFGAMADAPILPQLRALTIPSISERLDADELAARAPRFRHLERFRIVEIDVDDDERFPDRVRRELPNALLG